MINVLDFDSICETAASLQAIYVIKNMFYLIRIVAPIILIVMGMLDVLKMISASNPNQIAQGGRIIRRMFAAIAVFLVLLILDSVLNLLGKVKFSSSQCWNDATKQMVEAKYKQEELERKALDSAQSESLDSKKPQKSNGGIDYNENNDDDDSDDDSYDNDDDNYDSDDDDDSENGSEGDKIIAYAKKFVGNRYVYGGNDLNNGIDCSGFVMQVYAHFGHSLPRTSYEQCEQGKTVNGLENAKKGDILCFYDKNGRFGHVALYAGTLSNGEGKTSGVADGTKAMVHASNSRDFKDGGGIRFTSIQNYKTPGKIVRII